LYEGREKEEKRKERRFKGRKRRREEGMRFLQRRNLERVILPSMAEGAVL